MTDSTVQEDFLRAFHAVRPAVTAEAFGRGRGPDGRSSYELLRDRVAGHRRVLDLGCGDGLLLELLARDGGRQLAGVDLSPQSLALARRRPALSAARLHTGRAQELPFAEGSFDACVSHLALMLMGDIEQVAAEVARVLVPGGVLACVLGGGAVGGEAYERFVGLLRRAGERTTARIPALGDRRMRDREGFEEILRPVGFEDVEWETVPIDIGGTPEQVWDSVSGLYDLAPMEERAVARLRRDFFADVADLVTPEGLVPCGFEVRLASARIA
ncbi:class I SAM-dependent methyltransferase [Streptomyces malaysiense]|uniref:Ubiquinone biosynthesis protein UbiE n=1 Tax=Streptomyces malaysiense TaxID=1428626 RepID=A0A1J4Q2E1_9ACTN|nr:class I SAM-dependent methyltransferase [Streptomyces malaysiense]OIK27178.1 ubiquinone biosynthesis protein UbiE [Streptomyces malaysiense]